MLDFIVGNDTFAKELAARLHVKYVTFEPYHYPDGEPSPRILANYEDLEGKHGAVLGRLSYPTTPEKVSHFLEIIYRVVGNLTDEELYNVNSLAVILPWYVTSRHDHNPRIDSSEIIRIRDKGKDIGYKELIKSLKARRVSRIITFNPHFHIQEGNFQRYDINIVSLSGVEAINRHFKDVDENTVVVGRGKKGEYLADRLGRLLGLKSTSIETERVSSTETLYREKFDAKDRNVLAIDDVTTGAGIENFLMSIENAKNVDFSIIHATLSPEGYQIIRRLLNEKKIRQFVTTDTTITEFNRPDVTVTPELEAFLKQYS